MLEHCDENCGRFQFVLFKTVLYSQPLQILNLCFLPILKKIIYSNFNKSNLIKFIFISYF